MIKSVHDKNTSLDTIEDGLVTACIIYSSADKRNKTIGKAMRKSFSRYHKMIFTKNLVYPHCNERLWSLKIMNC